ILIPGVNYVLNTLPGGIYGIINIGSGLTPNYTPVPASNYYGNAGVGGSVPGNITGSFSGGSTFTVTAGSLAQGYVVPSGFGLSTTGSLAGGGGVVVTGSGFAPTSGTLTITGGTGNGTIVATGTGRLSWSTTGYAGPALTSSAVVYNVGPITIGTAAAFTGTAPRPGPLMALPPAIIQAGPAPANRSKVRIV